jgi:hypothetical protein
VLLNEMSAEEKVAFQADYNAHGPAGKAPVSS